MKTLLNESNANATGANAKTVAPRNGTLKKVSYKEIYDLFEEVGLRERRSRDNAFLSPTLDLIIKGIIMDKWN